MACNPEKHKRNLRHTKIEWTKDLKSGPAVSVNSLGDVQKEWDIFKVLQVQKKKKNMSIHGVVEKNYQPGFQYTPLTDLLVQHPCYVVASHGPLDLTRSDFLIPPLKFIHIPVITEIMGSSLLTSSSPLTHCHLNLGY